MIDLVFETFFRNNQVFGPSVLRTKRPLKQSLWSIQPTGITKQDIRMDAELLIMICCIMAPFEHVQGIHVPSCARDIGSRSCTADSKQIER